jgi:hypothetical protein
MQMVRSLSFFQSEYATRTFRATAIFLGVVVSSASRADTLILDCERESTLVPGWTAPMRITYAGAEQGTVDVAAKHVNFKLAGSKRTRAEDNAVVIEAFGETEAIMPDLAAVEACAAKSVPADLAGDADVYYTMSLSCLGSSAPGPTPVPIKASVSIGIVSASDVIVEIKQTYKAKSNSPDGKFSIDTFPLKCRMSGK